MGYSCMLIRKIRTDEEYAEVEKVIYGNTTGQLKKGFDSCFSVLDWYKKPRRSLRNNGVQAILFSFSYHNSPECDYQKWADTCLSWLGTNFIVNKDTLLAWETHKEQEEGHAFAVLVPIDPKEKISYQYYFSGRGALFEKISSFNNIMLERFDLKKPAKDTLITLLNSKRTLSYSAPGKEVPVPAAGESADDYRFRVQDYMLQRFVSDVNTQKEEYERLKEENMEIKKDMQVLYRLTKQAGAPDKWGPMLHTAQRLQYAIRSYQESADQERISAIANILRAGDDYMKKHRIKAIK